MNPPGELIEDLNLLEPANPWLIYYICGGIIGLLLLFLLIRALIRWIRRPRRRKGSYSGVRIAQAEALAALERLHPLIREGEGRTYAMECSAVLREYIERRFGLRATMRSTDEFLAGVQAESGMSEFKPLLERFFRRCDMLKFARGIADESELEELHTVATRFVRETRARRQEVHR